MNPNEPIVCSLEPGALRAQRDELLPGLVARADRVEEIDRRLSPAF
jgi:hypothetical protein